MSASWIILYGMTHAENRREPIWLFCFGLAVLYQIWFDVCIDWELLVIAPREEGNRCCAHISSVDPNSRVLLAVQRNIFQPLVDVFTCVVRRIPSFRQIQLRQRRLYKSDAFYWRILAYNAVMRFTWMLCFIPAYHLSSYGQKRITTFSSDTISYVGVLLPLAEILRRTFWGFLYLENKTIKMTGSDPAYAQLHTNELGEESEASLESVDSSKPMTRQFMPSWLGNQQQLQQEAAAPSSRFRQCFRCQFDPETQHKLFIAELSLWALLFVGGSLVATN
jgi:hypothetical protein